MMNFNETATPTIGLMGNRFAPWKIFCSVLDHSSDDSADAEPNAEDDSDGFDADDPRDLRVLDRLARLEAFSAA